jgi:hypothetical protein
VEEYSGVFARQKQSRLVEMRWFLDHLEDKIRSAPLRLGDDAPRAQKELMKLAVKVQGEIEKLENG